MRLQDCEERLFLTASRSVTSSIGPLQVYLLGRIAFEDALALQHRLVDEVAEGATPALLLCEHQPIVTVGRQGSHAHIHVAESELRQREWPVRWTNRAGGCWLHLPGQLAIYPILPLKRLRLPLHEFRSRFQQTIADTLNELEVSAQARNGSCDLWVNDRPIACFGGAVRDWVTYHGAVLNANPDLIPYRWVRAGRHYPPMTSLERERRSIAKPTLVRQRLIDHFAKAFDFDETLLFTDHVSLRRRKPAHVAVAYC